jgi:predicted acylesterase/phospholipase RssA
VEQGIARDNGYTAINTAFVTDLLASLEGSAVPTERARELRQTILDELLPLGDRPAYEGGPPLKDERWFHETIAEAYFGLRRYEEALATLKLIDWAEVNPWERETTARQFAWLARLLDPRCTSNRDFQQSEPWRVVSESLGLGANAGAASLFIGKLGLALSGGGFRASFFHIGVLAGLAELDVLRHVEVLSCVSGGSIVGAYYYLEVRQLLQTSPDDAITREDYRIIVERLAKNFLEGVQMNIRTRVVGKVWANLKMMFLPGYTRTNRLGELYEKYLYSRVQDDQKRKMRELLIRPQDDEDIQPKYDNWRRSNKVPILIINATTLNTGHNWQFTASWMGEPPGQIESDIDGNYRLRRMYYHETPSRHQDLRIGQAVAASSCVPGLFAPLELHELYGVNGVDNGDAKEAITVRLVDGGVHDNQGVFGLQDQDCQVYIVSDASGQMSAEDDPKDGIFSVLSRSNNITMARVRTAQYRDLASRRRTGRLKGFCFLHLKDGLEVRAKDWSGCDDPKRESQRGRSQTPRWDFRIQKVYQERLADIRTDLDSFNKVEAYALMTSGYNMIRAKFSRTIEGFPADPQQHQWTFLEIQKTLEQDKGPPADRVTKLLKVASQQAFKVWRLSRPLKGLAAAGGVGLLGASIWAALVWRQEPALTPRGLAAMLATAALTAFLGAAGLGSAVRVFRYRKTIYQFLVGAALSLVGAILAWVHLLFFDGRFLKKGEL